MTKEKWFEHIKAVGEHDRINCKECGERRKTKLANRAARERNQAYRDCGLVKVRGNLGGTYWE